MTNWLLWLSVLWLPLLTGAILKNSTKFKKNLAVGVTLPPLARQDPEVLALLETFKKQENQVCWGLIAAGVLCCLLAPDFSASFFLWGLWIIGAIVLPYLPFIRCNRALTALKEERGWKKAPASVVMVDTAAIPPARAVNPLWFALLLVLGLLPLLWESSFLILYLMNALTILVCWAGERYLIRRKSEQVRGDLALTQALTLIRRRSWSGIWLATAVFMVLVSWDAALLYGHPLWMSAVLAVCTIVLILVILRLDFHTRALQEKLTRDLPADAFPDEDENWIWGIFYYNPRDSHLLVNDRVGSNSTFNLAKPAGKVIFLLTALLLAVIPLTGVLADQPPVLALEDGVLRAGSGFFRYEIPLGEIAFGELREELPENLIRVAGTGLEHLLKGKYTAKDLGPVNLCLDPDCAPFLLLETKEGKLYLLGSRVPGQAASLLSQLPG